MNDHPDTKAAHAAGILDAVLMLLGHDEQGRTSNV